MYKYLFVLAFILMISCIADKEVPPLPMTPEESKMSMKYLALGDSYTIGESVKESERWPNQLALKLVNDNVVESDTTQIIAQTGWTTLNLKNGIGNAAPNDEYDLVSLLIGVNNFYQGRTLAEYEIQFTELLEGAVKYAGGDKNKVFVVSIPDYAYTPFGNGAQSISEGIDDFNEANKRIAESYGITYIDITPISRRGLAEPNLVANDGLHPSGKQYALWVDEMYTKIKDKVE